PGRRKPLGMLPTFDQILVREDDRRIAIRAVLDAPDHAVVNANFREKTAALHVRVLQTPRRPIRRLEAGRNLPRLIAIVGADARTTVVHRTEWVGALVQVFERTVPQPQICLDRFRRYPDERDARERLVRITAADVGV